MISRPPFDPVKDAPPAALEPGAAPVSPPPAPGPLPAPGAAPDPLPSGGPSPEPGYTTTEFWVAVPVSAVGLAETLGWIHVGPAALQSIAGLVLLVAPSVAYILGRSLRKAGLGG